MSTLGIDAEFVAGEMIDLLSISEDMYVAENEVDIDESDNSAIFTYVVNGVPFTVRITLV